MTAYELLIDTARFYGTDPSRRAVTKRDDGIQGACVYQMEDGRRCAIGRYVDVPEQFNCTALGGIMSAIENSPLCGININDLHKIQSLHDRDVYWSETGLSKRGRKHFTQLARKFRHADYEFRHADYDAFSFALS